MDTETSTAQSSDAALAHKLLHALPAPVAVIDVDGRIDYCNPACERLAGCSAAQLQGTPAWEAMIAPAARAGFEQVFHAWLAGQAVSAHEAPALAADGEPRRFAWRFGRLGEGAVPQAILIGMELSPTLAAPARLQTLEEAACRGTLGEILGELAHEVNQPLSAVLNFSRGAMRLLERGSPELDVGEVFERIATQSERAAQMIRELRDRLRRETAQSVPLSLGELLDQAAGLLRPEACARGLRLSLAPPAADRVLADPELALLLLVQLLRLAMQAAEEGAGSELAVTTASAGPRVEVCVSSPDADAHDWPVPDATLSAGIGLDAPRLALCRRIAQAHGGQLTIGSEPGAGYAARFTLPLAEG